MYDNDDFDDDGYDVPCPHCGRVIFEGVDQCPHCREYISSGDFRKPTPKWLVILIVLTIVSLLFPTISVLLNMLR
jgi:uncharacterized protein (DUF983 family)